MIFVFPTGVGALIFIEDFSREASSLHSNDLFSRQWIGAANRYPDSAGVGSLSPDSCCPGRMSATAELGQERPSRPLSEARKKG
jgi:hypothetical protein